MARYSVNNYTVETLLSNIKSGSIAIPEMQRPFVWDSSKVRDLVDSLYKGFPVGYIIVWQNPDVKLKDGTKSSGKKVLIDGQQRITAMAAAIVGQEVLDDHYKWKRICKASGLTKKEYCIRHGLSEKSFYYRQKKLRTQIAASAPELVPLEMASPVEEELQIRYRGAELKLPSGVDMDAVAALLRSVPFNRYDGPDQSPQLLPCLWLHRPPSWN